MYSQCILLYLYVSVIISSVIIRNYLKLSLDKLLYICYSIDKSSEKLDNNNNNNERMIMMTMMKKKTTVKKTVYFTPTRRVVMKKNEEEVEYITRVFRCLYDFDLMGVWNSLSTTEKIDISNGNYYYISTPKKVIGEHLRDVLNYTWMAKKLLEKCIDGSAYINTQNGSFEINR